MSNVEKWSVVAANNNQPAPNGWPENMAPSDVNNSARENMAAVKRFSLSLPYVSTGGVVLYVDDTTVSIADDSLDTNYAKYFKEGQRVKVESSSGESLGLVTTSEYSSGTSVITVKMDTGVLPTTLTDVKYGLNYEDIANAVGPNLLGMVLPYTADIDNLPFGFGLADGEAFDPLLYTALAKLYYTGQDEDGNDTYKYGQKTVNGRVWPLKPDVRGYFPRFLDNREAPATGLESEEEEDTRVDPSAPRSVGSTQEDAIRDITGNIVAGENNTWFGSASGAFSLTNVSWVDSAGSSNRPGRARGFAFSASGSVPTAEENRPKNVALPGLLVMYGGYASADAVKPENLVAKVMEQVDPKITAIKTELDAEYTSVANELNAAIEAIPVQVETALDSAVAQVKAEGEVYVAQAQSSATSAASSATSATTEANRAKTEADRAASVVAGAQKAFVSQEVTITASQWNAVTNTYVIGYTALGADDLVLIGPASTAEDISAWSDNGVYASAQTAGVGVTLTCNSVPETLKVSMGVFPK